MFGSNQKLVVELRSLIQQLGTQGGLVSPSVYETAQVLRLHPPKEGVVPGLRWLLSQQREDGGWGLPTAPLTRDVPTLAAILALHTYRHELYRHELAVDCAIHKGLAFLQQQATHWQQMHIDLLGVACEMIVPHLLEEAAHAGLRIDPTPYAPLFKLRKVKLQYLQSRPLRPNSAPTFSWEALGFPHQSNVLNAHTGVGHSPAATAAWLHTAYAAGEEPARCAQAEEYLARAAASTATNIPGVMPMVYPITGFELCYGLYPLAILGLLDHPELYDVVAPKVARLHEMVRQEQGLGFGEGFIADVDDTAVSVVVLKAAARQTDVNYVRRFWQKDHFYTYDHELNPSVYSNAHALHALVLSGERCQETENYLVQQQTEQGAWNVDKWHTSWRSCTMEVVVALLPLGYDAQLKKAGQALLADQNADGSWGTAENAFLETTYSLITLQLLASQPRLASQLESALVRGRQWLTVNANRVDDVACLWLCKETYSPIRVDEVFKLCALLLSTSDSASSEAVAASRASVAMTKVYATR